MVTLTVDFGHVLSEPELPHRHQPRNGPARQRRREKRAAARNLSAGEATPAADKASEEEDVVPAETEKVEEDDTPVKNESAGKALVTVETVTEIENLLDKLPIKNKNPEQATTNKKEVKLI